MDSFENLYYEQSEFWSKDFQEEPERERRKKNVSFKNIIFAILVSFS